MNMAKVKTLLAMACDGVGPSSTCINILNGMQAAQLHDCLYISRNRISIDNLNFKAAVPKLLSILPYRHVQNWASRKSEETFLKDLQPGDIAYLWPKVSLATHEAVHKRGNPILLEGINTRMAYARQILDRAYDAAGLEPVHGITDQRIAEEEEKYRLATATFAPSPGVEASLEGSPIRPDGIVPSSYGVSVNRHRQTELSNSGKITVVFVGYACVRKGVHQLLRAWAAAGIDGTLVIAGEIEPAIQSLCAEELDRADVQYTGFTRDVNSLYARADVFVLPSFEEGDPLVTYEAAASGLPLVTSLMGGGRMASESGCSIMIDPEEPGTISEALRTLAGSYDLRVEMGRQAYDAVQNYDWKKVGVSRVAMLKDLLRTA